MSAGIAHAYRYREPSTLEPGRLRLSTSRAPGEEGADPFVRARVVEPRAVALALRLVSDVVRSRHHVPAAMLERILLEADPVLTWGGELLRVEGFSSCCGIYARADIAAAALETSTARPGTTNVDFNAPMRSALAQVRDAERLDLEIGAEGVALARAVGGARETVVERKVQLPLRWLRGLLEVQAIQARMQRRLELERSAAIRFLRGLPRAGRASDASWIVPSGRSARLGSTRREGAVRLAGLARLRALEPALPLAARLVVDEDPLTGASSWRLEGDLVRLSVVLSPETWRGFSGEGQALAQLATTEPTKTARVRALLAWQSALRSDEVVARAQVDEDTARAALAWLASRGLVGYDLACGAWFHRVLPFDLDETRRLLAAQQPRLREARALVAADAVKITRRDEHTEGEVRSKGVVHRVRLEPGAERCTCTWFAKHQGQRGPCKHLLAVELALGAEERR